MPASCIISWHGSRQGGWDGCKGCDYCIMGINLAHHGWLIAVNGTGNSFVVGDDNNTQLAALGDFCTTQTNSNHTRLALFTHTHYTLCVENIATFHIIDTCNLLLFVEFNKGTNHLAKVSFSIGCDHGVSIFYCVCFTISCAYMCVDLGSIYQYEVDDFGWLHTTAWLLCLLYPVTSHLNNIGFNIKTGVFILFYFIFTHLDIIGLLF